MSKRGAEGERVGESHEIEDNSKMDVPRKANAAQMARRKIATAKGHRGSPAARARPVSTPQTQSQNFGVNGTQQQNGFTFGSQSFGGTSTLDAGAQEQSQSASFPSFAPPSSQFNFSTKPSTNPFSQLSNIDQTNPSTNGTGSTGFPSNIFNFQSSQPAPTQPAANGTSIFSNQQTLPQTSNLFGSFTQQKPSSQPSNPFQFNATPNQPSLPAEDKPETHEESNIFGMPSHSPGTPSAPKQSTSSDFSTLHSSQGATSPVDMMMSTSPDTSPKSVQPSPTKVSTDMNPPQNPFASLLPSKAPEPASTPQQSSIFSDMPKATASTDASMPASDTAPTTQKSSGRLFDRISYPDPTKDSGSTKTQNTASAHATSNIFGDISTANASKATNSLFVPETQQPASSTNMFGELAKQDAQKDSIRTQESFRSASTGKSLFDRIPPTNQAEVLGSTQTPNSSKASTQEKAPTDPKSLFSGFASVNQATSSSQPSSTSKSTSNIFASVGPTTVAPAKDSIFTPFTPTSFGTSSKGSEVPAPSPFQPPTSTNTPTAAQPSNFSIATFSTSSSPTQSISSPPFSGTPTKDTSNDSDNLRLIAWRRIKAINDGLQLMLDAPGADKDAIMEFIKSRKQAVADTAGIKLEGTGSKRRAEHDEQPGQSPEKRTRFQQTPQQIDVGNQKPLFSGALTNGIVSQSPFSPEKQPIGAKRKAGPADDQDSTNNSSDTGNKRTRPDDIGTLKTLPANGSQTSQLFASIVGKAPDKSASTKQTTAPDATGFGGNSSNENFDKSNSVASAMFSKSTPSQPSQSSATAKPAFGKPTGDEPRASAAASSPSIFFGSQSSAGKVPPPSEPTASWNPPKCLPAFGSAPAEPPAVQQVPTFGAGGASNFLAQFGKKAEESEKRELEKRKAEDYDSEEDDLEEWKKRDAEKQAERRRQLAETSKGKSTVFTPSGFMLSDSENARASSIGPESGASSRRPSDSSAKVSFTSVLDEPQPTTNGTKNIFAHLSDNDSAVEGSKHGDADDEETGSEGEAQSTTPKASTSKTSNNIFDRIGPMNNISSGEAPKKVFNPFASAGPTSSIFGQGKSSDKSANPFATSNNNISNTSTPKANPFAPSGSFGSDSSTPRANIFGASTSPSGDNTWKPDTPIKFGGQSATAPEVKVSSPSPVKSNMFGNLFGGAPAPAPDSPSKAPTGVVSSSPAKPSVGFDFGSGKMNLGNSFLTPKANTFAPTPAAEISDAASRATSPGLSTAGESANESAADDEGNKDEQLDLLSGADEEGEEKLFEVRAKALMFDPKLKEKDPEANVWPVKGVGPLRVLKNKETKATRILLRADPSGKIVLNAGLIKGAKYEHSASKSVKLPIANEEKGLSTYMIRVGKDEDAKRLAEILEGNKGD